MVIGKLKEVIDTPHIVTSQTLYIASWLKAVLVFYRVQVG